MSSDLQQFKRETDIKIKQTVGELQSKQTTLKVDLEKQRDELGQIGAACHRLTATFDEKLRS
jgi:hypothetical protein